MNSHWGKIQVYTGYGKGKTTAALGLVIRALGRGKKAAIVYFDKGGNHYGEREILDQLAGDNFQYFVTGAERFDPESKTFRFGVEERDKQEAEQGLKIVEDLFKKASLDLLVLDEINSTISLGMLKLEDVLDLLNKKPPGLELVLTGRDAHPRILEKADLVTEMKMVKHYFYQGTEAREGIEY
ncbi:MAG: hypothetical protein A2927_00050 [Candidatus Komeilibacteria bacterium RIFCSPLOWO2_01_FULL_45_10]|uniref:Cob(I)yrinic acid a,c-diamide adenosyltransferase n=1 Tax=Candidatus Komeilibacteria bacterium RIFCSPLOWO2_01_FULL_45_10 TaxID=1798550 RepID=A0A1G2BKU4_9BACT|nr:MAG: hypothetical protein A2927_00050 [Candidatus Komeilibacteria bacterium RIFCSPLOWO2_01_FULL_45_10]